MASKVQTRAYDAIDALNTLAQRGDKDALDAMIRVREHCIARIEQTEGVLASRPTDPDEDLL